MIKKYDEALGKYQKTKKQYGADSEEAKHAQKEVKTAYSNSVNHGGGHGDSSWVKQDAINKHMRRHPQKESFNIFESVEFI